MFDRSLLPPALFEFVVVADTHYALDPGAGAVEFASRRSQTARAEVALRLAASLDAAFVAHLGDLVQEYPDTPAFPPALQAALQQLHACGVDPRHVAGNHDVGDKPDPTMPTRPVTPASLRHYHAVIGPSWYGFDHGGCRFVVLNSQILNTPLPEANEQKEWVERHLDEHFGARIVLLLHLPPYLCDSGEPALGHYDNIAELGRSWLLDLVRRHGVELMMAGHVHCAFFDRIGETRYRVANSTSFTRPGFCHMFTGAPPPDQGRDDAPKLGFTLCRVLEDRIDLHWLRTRGATEESAAAIGQELVTRTPRALSEPVLALTLRHPLSWVTDVPMAWPSAIRQTVRNDYPLLACLELGAGAVRVPARDLDDPFLARRIALLRDEGVRVMAGSIWSDDFDPAEWLGTHRDEADGLELQLAGTPWPTANQLRGLHEWTDRGVESSLSTIISHEKIAGKQHRRTRHGFRIEELVELNELLATAEARVDRVRCRLDPSESAWDGMRTLVKSGSLSHIGKVDVSLELTGVDDAAGSGAVAEALLGAAPFRGLRVYVDPLIDFDRTMDVRHGLLDTLCNPRPAFHVARCLNTILAAERERIGPEDRFEPADKQTDNGRILSLRSPRSLLTLLLPGSITDAVSSRTLQDHLRDAASVRIHDLVAATVLETAAGNVDRLLGTKRSGPILLVSRK